MTLSLPCVSINTSVAEIAQKIELSDGVVIVNDLPQAPFGSILELLQNSPDVASRLNKAFPKTRIFKDSSSGNIDSKVDRKRSLDLSPERLEIIAKADPAVVEEEALQEPLTFYKSFQESVEAKLIPALAEVVGTSKIKDDLAFSYRMLDYYPSSNEKNALAPRLAEHRDFGFISLIQATHAGLQVRLGNKWHDLPPIPNGSAILMGGWCAKIRSNGRLPAILHRVTKHYDDASRVSAVLFCNPKSIDTPLEPMVHAGENQKYISGVNAAELQKRLADSKTERSVDQWLEVRNKEKKINKFWSKFRRPDHCL